LGFITAQEIETAFRRDECHIFLPYGPLGIGKSSFAIKVVAEVYGKDGQPNYEAVKSHLVFHPRDFVAKCSQMMERGEKDKVLIWDDAGLWLFALDYHHPFVKAVIKYLNVARTNWGSLIFTTPLPTWVLKKIRGFPQATTLKITKSETDSRYPYRPRIANAYRYWISPDMKKSGVKGIYQDKFNAILPQVFYWEWYKPLRDSYAAQAVAAMSKHLASLKLEEEVKIK